MGSPLSDTAGVAVAAKGGCNDEEKVVEEVEIAGKGSGTALATPAVDDAGATPSTAAAVADGDGADAIEDVSISDGEFVNDDSAATVDTVVAASAAARFFSESIRDIFFDSSARARLSNVFGYDCESKKVRRCSVKIER